MGNHTEFLQHPVKEATTVSQVVGEDTEAHISEQIQR